MTDFLHMKKKLRKVLTMGTGLISRQEMDMKEEEGERDWSSLHDYLQDMILNRLVSLADYVRYGAVCKSWFLVTLEERNRRYGPQLKKKNVLSSLVSDNNHQLPMLMLPSSFDETRAAFYSVTHERMLNFELSVPYHQRFVGSSFGWLISVNSNFEITLFNPFYSHNNVPQIPSFYLHGGDNASDLRRNVLYNHEYYIVKAVLSADPYLHPDDYALVIIFGKDRRLAFFEPTGKPIGMRYWSYLRRQNNGFSDLIYFDNAFYALHSGGEVMTFKIQKDDNMEPGIVVSPPVSIGTSCFARYIVESCSGCPGAEREILQVLRYGEPSKGEFPSYSTLNFQVFRFDCSCGKWVELNSLGDQVLFVGDNSSLSVLASDFPGCQPGAIYYSFGFHPEILSRKLTGDITDHCDTGVFNLENRRVGPLKISYDHALCYAMHQFPPVWVVPTFRAPNLSITA